MPSIGEYHESATNRDSSMGWDALGICAPGCWPLVCPSLAIPNIMVSWGGCRTQLWASLDLVALGQSHVPGYIDAHLDEIEKAAALPARNLASRIEDEVVP